MRIPEPQATSHSAVLLLVVYDISCLPILDPCGDAEYFHFSLDRRRNNTLDAGINDHFFADKTGNGVDGFPCSEDSAVDIHVAAEKAHAGTGSVDDGVLFGMNASAELVSLAVGDVELVPQA